MSNEYRNNHYVPQWYQKRFLPAGQFDQGIFYLDFKPREFKDSKGIVHTDKAFRRQGFRLCFAEKDFYTSNFSFLDPNYIEKVFFGEIDNQGHTAVEYFTTFSHPSANANAFQNMMMFMSTQKLRTIKGLEWLASKAGTKDREQVLNLMLRMRQLYCAIWTECIWQIADASKSPTKFIVSDHPVTVYNRRCGPRSQWCRGVADPDIWFHATHTIFPLTLNKVLILTNLSWVRNPYQSETAVRPNPNPLRDAIFDVMGVQIARHLNEQEVREINFIIKSRARRYIAAASEEWLFPERYVSKSQWNTFGNGYLLMPDPRGVPFKGELIIGYKDGTSTGFDPYGRRPWQAGFGKEKERSEFKTLQRFQGEFARLFGPNRRGRAFEMDRLDPERDDDAFHEYHLSLE
jgi:hypothetical protein